MRAQRPVLADRYVVHLPVDLGDAASRFVGTSVATGQPVVIAVVAVEWAKFEQRGVSLAHRNLATLIEVVQRPDPAQFPPGAELPRSGAVLVAELMRGKSLHELLVQGPIAADRAVAWTIRLLEALAVLHQRDVWHGAISSAAVVAEPKSRAIAPVLSRAMIPPLRDYSSFERLLGDGPSISDDLWAVGVLLFEMLAGRRPFEASAVASGKIDLPREAFGFLGALPHGPELEPVLRRALASQSRRFLTTTEFIDVLDRWERRLPSGPLLTEVTVRTRTVPKGRGPAPWDPVVEELNYGVKRVEATFDAAEQMRQTVVASDSQAPKGRSKQDSKSATQADRAGLASADKRATDSHRVLGPASNPVRKSSAPKSRRRFSSFGPEMAAFAERSRPKLKPWLYGFAGLFVASAVTWGVWSRFDDRRLASASTRHVGAAGLTAPAASQDSKQPKMTAREETSQCIRSYFREDAVVPGIELEFVCKEEDFLSVTRRLHEDSMAQFLGSTPVPRTSDTGHRETGGNEATKADVSAPAESASATVAIAVPTASASPGNPALVVRSGTTTRGWQLGWYDLVATAIIRQNCCREAAPIRLPETTGWCQQLQSVVRRIGADSAKVGDISPGVRTFDEAINCLMAQGKHVTYPYKAVPSALQKSAFQQFLKHAAEADAKRASRR